MYNKMYSICYQIKCTIYINIYNGKIIKMVFHIRRVNMKIYCISACMLLCLYDMCVSRTLGQVPIHFYGGLLCGKRWFHHGHTTNVVAMRVYSFKCKREKWYDIRDTVLSAYKTKKEKNKGKKEIIKIIPYCPHIIYNSFSGIGWITSYYSNLTYA